MNINYLHSPIEEIALKGLNHLNGAIGKLNSEIVLLNGTVEEYESQMVKSKKDLEDCQNNQHLIEAEVEVVAAKLKAIAEKINFKEFITFNIGGVRQSKGYKWDGTVIGYDELVIENEKLNEHRKNAIREYKIKIKAYESRLEKINEYLNIK